MPTLDASLVVALVLESDEHHRRAVPWAVQSRANDETWNVPSIVLSEVAATLGRQTRRSDLAREFLLEFPRFRNVRVASVDSEAALRSATIAAEHRLKGCDAVYVALAADLDDVLVTFDREQAERAAPVVRVVVPG